MYCSLDWLCDCGQVAVARVHPDGGLGDPWQWSCVVRRQGTLAVLLAASSAPTPSQARALFAALRQAGFTERLHERIKGGGAIVPVRQPIPGGRP